MRRVPLAAMLAILSAALVLGGNALLDAGWGSALRSIADRVLPNPEIAMWAPAPEPGSHASSYADATGAGANYVYLVDAADDRGNVRELQLIFFGRESNGEGWLEIEARGGSGVRYRACDAAEAPAAAREALDAERGASTMPTGVSGGRTWRGYWQWMMNGRSSTRSRASSAATAMRSSGRRIRRRSRGWTSLASTSCSATS
ncbi:hypothetical protein BIANG_1612 [Bifidobacterium angulatum]|nr:hypothetical protein BIANG_1612 [Bifidobacterium angulatum]